MSCKWVVAQKSLCLKRANPFVYGVLKKKKNENGTR